MVEPDLDSDLILLDLQHWEDYTMSTEPSTLITPLSNSSRTTSLPESRSSPAPEKLSVGWTNSAIQPKEPGSFRRRRKCSKLCDSSEHEVHIFTERERRKKMRSMFSNLHALLPHLPPKVDKSTVVDEAIVYIKSLEKTLQDLQKRKQEIGRETFLADQGSCSTYQNGKGAMKFSPFSCSFQTWTSPNVVLNICGEDAQIGMCSTWKSGLLSSILCILEKYKLEVVTAHISSDNNRCIYMFHIHATGLSNQFHETMAAEEQFKLAVGEMILCLSS